MQHLMLNKFTILNTWCSQVCAGRLCRRTLIEADIRCHIVNENFWLLLIFWPDGSLTHHQANKNILWEIMIYTLNIKYKFKYPKPVYRIKTGTNLGNIWWTVINYKSRCLLQEWKASTVLLKLKSLSKSSQNLTYPTNPHRHPLWNTIDSERSTQVFNLSKSTNTTAYK